MLGSMAGIAALMGSIPTVSASTLKPDEVETSGVDELMAEIEAESQKQTDADLSGCIHVMNPNRIADMPGATVLDNGVPKTINGMM